MPLLFSLSPENSLRCFLSGSGYGSVGRADASDTKYLRFRAQHRQHFIYQITLKLKRQKYWSQQRVLVPFSNEAKLLHTFHKFNLLLRLPQSHSAKYNFLNQKPVQLLDSQALWVATKWHLELFWNIICAKHKNRFFISKLLKTLTDIVAVLLLCLMGLI